MTRYDVLGLRDLDEFFEVSRTVVSANRAETENISPDILDPFCEELR
jgi:hypothetical protein